MRLVRAPIAPVILFVLILASCSQPSQFDAWTVGSLTKVFPDELPPSSAAAEPELLMPRNGHGSFQVAVRPKISLTGFSIAADINSEGNTIETTLHRVGTVTVRANTPDSAPEELIRTAPGEFPDPLFETIPSQLSADRTETFWITVYVPANVPAGTYSGEVRIQTADSSVTSLPFSIKVAKATVPPEQTLKVTNWFSTSQEHFARYYPLEGDRENYWKVMENIGKVMAAHRQNVILTPVPDLVRVEWKQGKYSFDFAEFDRWVDTFTRAGIIGTIEGGHLLTRSKGYFSPVVVPAWVQENGKLVNQLLDPEDPRAEHYLRSYLKALYTHLEEKAWLNNYVQHLHDEPHGEEVLIYEKYAQIVRECLPDVPIVDAVDLEEDTGFLEKYLDIWVPVLSSFDDKFSVLTEHRQKGGQTWYYTCVNPQGGYLNRFIDYSLLKMRLLHWFNFRHELTGYLHWGGNYWSDKPFENVEPVINDGQTLLPPGDNALVYPDPERLSVLSSIRLAVMREGIEDYELLIELSKRDPGEAERIVREMIPQVLDYKRENSEFQRLYSQLLESPAWNESPDLSSKRLQ